MIRVYIYKLVWILPWIKYYSIQNMITLNMVYLDFYLHEYLVFIKRDKGHIVKTFLKCSAPKKFIWKFIEDLEWIYLA